MIFLKVLKFKLYLWCYFYPMLGLYKLIHKVSDYKFFEIINDFLVTKLELAEETINREGQKLIFQ